MEIKIAAFSDTHTREENVIIPRCDIAIFAGDISSRGERSQVEAFLDWYDSCSMATYKIWVAGNHDLSLDPFKNPGNELPDWVRHAIRSHDNLIYLCNSSVNIMGLNIWGSPFTPDFYPENWAFNKSRGAEIAKIWSTIPNNTDILVVHGPAKGWLDAVPMRYNTPIYPAGNVGCADLRDRMFQLKQLKLFVTGHIHDNTGIIPVDMENRKIIYCNAACVDNNYQFKHQPQKISLDV